MGLFGHKSSSSSTKGKSKQLLPVLAPSLSSNNKSHNSSSSGGRRGAGVHEVATTGVPQLPPLSLGVGQDGAAEGSSNMHTPPRSSARAASQFGAKYEPGGGGVRPGEIYPSAGASPAHSFYKDTASLEGPRGGGEAGAAGGEAWRNVLGGAVRPPSSMMGGEARGTSWDQEVRREYQTRRRTTTEEGDEKDFGSDLPPRPPPRRSSLAAAARLIPQDAPTSPRREPSSPSQDFLPIQPPSLASAPSPPPRSGPTAHHYSPLQAFYGVDGPSPTPSHSSTFAPSSESRMSVAGQRVETPVSETEEDKFTRASLEQEEKEGGRAAERVEEEEQQTASPQRQRIAYDYKPVRALAAAVREQEEEQKGEGAPPPSPSTMGLAPALPVTSPPATLRPPTTPTKSRLGSPPSTPPRRPATKTGKDSTPRANAIAMARERSEHESPGSTVPPLESAQDDEAEAEEERRPTREAPPRPKLEQVLVGSTEVLRRLLLLSGWGEVCALRATSRGLKKRFEEGEGRELVLERFLGGMGYRTLRAQEKEEDPRRGLERQSTAPRAESRSKNPSPTSKAQTITLTLRDLDAFFVGLQISPEQYASFAVQFLQRRLHPNTLRLVRASTRAWTRVVLRLRAQSTLPTSALKTWAFVGLQEEEKGAGSGDQKVFKVGRAPSLKVWVPTKGGGSWMDDAEVIECEREVWRSGVWSEMKRGDVVSNMAISAVGNIGKLLHDGKFLRDFSFAFDAAGHLPPWLNAVVFSPGYYHNIVASSTSSPVIYLALQSLLPQVTTTLVLCDDKVTITSPQGTRQVKRFVYRAAAQIHPGQPVVEGREEVAHQDWVGTIIFEADGTAEMAKVLTARVSSIEPTPYRVLREKSRPGRLWLRPVTDSEAC